MAPRRNGVWRPGHRRGANGLQVRVCNVPGLDRLNRSLDRLGCMLGHGVPSLRKMGPAEKPELGRALFAKPAKNAARAIAPVLLSGKLVGCHAQR